MRQLRLGGELHEGQAASAAEGADPTADRQGLLIDGGVEGRDGGLLARVV